MYKGDLFAADLINHRLSDRSVKMPMKEKYCTVKISQLHGEHRYGNTGGEINRICFIKVMSSGTVT